MKNAVLATLAAIGSFIANLLGGWDAALTVLVCCMVIDVLMGLAVAAIFHKSPKTEGGLISSTASFKGMTKKVIVLILVGLAAQLDKMLGADYIRNMAIFFYIGSEGLSILENMVLMNVPFPAFIKRLLEVMRDKGDDGE